MGCGTMAIGSVLPVTRRGTGQHACCPTPLGSWGIVTLLFLDEVERMCPLNFIKEKRSAPPQLMMVVLWCFSLNPHRRSPYPNSQLESRDKLRESVLWVVRIGAIGFGAFFRPTAHRFGGADFRKKGPFGAH